MTTNTTTHTCDFTDATAYICDRCYVTGCGECLRDLGEARICGACWDKEEAECREAEAAYCRSDEARRDVADACLDDLPF